MEAGAGPTVRGRGGRGRSGRGRGGGSGSGGALERVYENNRALHVKAVPAQLNQSQLLAAHFGTYGTVCHLHL